MDECVFYAAISADGYLAGPDGDIAGLPNIWPTVKTMAILGWSRVHQRF